MNEENAIGYYSIIPSTILYNNNLKPNQKLLYAIITSLSCKKGYCFATNKYLADKLNAKPKTVSTWISDLKDKNYIIVEIIKDEKNQVAERRIYINDTPYPFFNGYPYPKKNGEGIPQKTEYNNINNNIKYNNKHHKNSKSNFEQREYENLDFL